MNNTKSLNSIELIQQLKEKGFLYSNSAIKCNQCKIIFPVEYEECPQCKVDELWQIFDIQFKKIIGANTN